MTRTITLAILLIVVSVGLFFAVKQNRAEHAALEASIAEKKMQEQKAAQEAEGMPAAPEPGQQQEGGAMDQPTSNESGVTEKNDDDIVIPLAEEELPADEFADPVTDEESGQDEAIQEALPEGLSHVEAGMVDYESCVAGGGEVAEGACTTFDGRTFTSGN